MGVDVEHVGSIHRRVSVPHTIKPSGLGVCMEFIDASAVRFVEGDKAAISKHPDKKAPARANKPAVKTSFVLSIGFTD
jgi:hypothetical protein